MLTFGGVLTMQAYHIGPSVLTNGLDILIIVLTL